MLLTKDFRCELADNSHLTVVHKATGLRLTFVVLDQEALFGHPEIVGKQTTYPAWLMTWFAGSVGQKWLHDRPRAGAGSTRSA